MPIYDLYSRLIPGQCLHNAQVIFAQDIFAMDIFAQASNIDTLLTYGFYPHALFSPITYQYHVHQSLPYINLIFSHILFEYQHNMQTQLVSIVIPSLNPFHVVTAIG